MHIQCIGISFKVFLNLQFLKITSGYDWKLCTQMKLRQVTIELIDLKSLTVSLDYFLISHFQDYSLTEVSFKKSKLTISRPEVNFTVKTMRQIYQTQDLKSKSNLN
jgi:hypothetical protein